jgi:hypothetical protein
MLPNYVATGLALQGSVVFLVKHEIGCELIRWNLPVLHNMKDTSSTLKIVGLES